MRMNFSRIFPIIIVVALGACGGDENLYSGVGGGDGGGGGGGGEAGSVSMALTAGLSNISAGGSTGLTVSFRQDGAPYSGDASATFNSTCVSNGTAVINSTSLETSTGTITATYVDQGCGQTDTITAVGTANSQTLTDTVNVTVAAAEAGSIQFVTAEPEIIGIRGGGSGLPEQSLVSFRVLNTVGGPAAGREVTFTLNNTNGGIDFGDGSTTTTSTSGADGYVTVVVRAGTVLTSVRVTASHTDPTSSTLLSTQSSNLTVSTGLPDQNSFSLSVTRLNNAGFDCDGETDTFNIRASDRNNNPVPSGTGVTFTTEGGDIESTCFTGTDSTTGTQADGVCSLIWESQNPRPVNGRSTVLAYAEGEESFSDLNSNGVFDDGDTFTDLGEAFHDFDEDDVRDADEPYIEFNGTAGFQGTGDGKYNGLICQHSTLCGAKTAVTVRESIALVMGSNSPYIDRSADVVIDDSVGGDDEIDFVGESDFAVFTVLVRDVRDQIMPMGTTVSLATDVGSVLGENSFTVPNSNFSGVGPGTVFEFLLKGPTGTERTFGIATLKVVTPASACGGGTTTSYGFFVEYTPPPPAPP